MNFTSETLFGQFYQIAQQFLVVVVGTMDWLFFEPFSIVQRWYWDVYSAVTGTWYNDFFKPVYQYLAWASGAPNVTGDEISLGVFILTAGVSIWIFIRVCVMLTDILLRILEIFTKFASFGKY